MKESSYYGELIRMYRLRRGLTQEELAQGICSTSELSKIETGNRVPSAEIFMALMKALGVHGYSFFSMIPDKKVRMFNLEKAIRAAADNGDAGELLELMHTFRQLMDPNRLDDLIFTEMTELIFYRMCGFRDKAFGRRALGYLEMIHPGLVEDIGIYDNSLTRQERVLVNSIGIGFIDMGEYENAYRFFHFMYKSVHDDSDEIPEVLRSRAVALNNMSLCMTKLKHFDAAQRMCKRAAELACKCDVRLWIGIMESFAELYQFMGIEEKADDLLDIIKYQDCLLRRAHVDYPEISLYNHSDGMLIL